MWERISEVFDYFVGIDAINNYQLERVVVLQNEDLERRFQRTYKAISNYEQKQPHWLFDINNSNKYWQQAILEKLSNYVSSVSGDEQTNLVLCWHGGCRYPFSVAKENFTIDRNNEGPFGNGIYFTKFFSYGDMFSQQ